MRITSEMHGEKYLLLLTTIKDKLLLGNPIDQLEIYKCEIIWELQKWIELEYIESIEQNIMDEIKK